jgi:hypothetical protein
LWEDVVDTDVYFIKKGTSRSLYGGILEEAWTCKMVKHSFLNTFSCEAFVHIHKEK